jgi:hypothetical protein
MDTLLERLSSTQIVAVIAIVVGGIVALAMIWGITKYQLQALTDDTSLKREHQQTEAALKQKIVERGGMPSEASLDELLTPETSAVDEDSEKLNAELAMRFGDLALPTSLIESTMARAMATDPTRKRTIINALDELSEREAQPAAILAAIRPLCHPAGSADEKEPVVVAH